MEPVIEWLMSGDPAIQYMTKRFVLNEPECSLREIRNKISREGFGAWFLSCRGQSGHWGQYYYQPKWTSTHYTLLDLKNLFIPLETDACRQMCERMLLECLPDNGALNLAKSNIPSDICVDGMALNYLSYFCPENKGIKKLLDFLLEHQKKDGGFTWYYDKTTGDPHTTVCVLEGFHQYICSGNMYRLEDVLRASESALGYLLENNLFMDANDKRFRMLAYPFRYHYSVFRALCYCTTAQIDYDVRMKPAIQWLTDKKGIDGKWQLEYTYPGKVHFEMEQLHNPSRFITQKALVISGRYSKP
jgi:hypothetical protein